MPYFGIAETIKEYRDILQVTQKELANERLSSNLIKILESGKKRLTIPTALLLVENINEIAEQKGIPLKVSIKDILVSNQEYTEKVIRKKLDDIKSGDFKKEKFDELLEKAERFELYNILEEIYFFIYQNTYKAQEYELSVFYLLKLIEANIKLGNIVDSVRNYNMIGVCQYLLGNYDEAIKYINIALNTYKENETDDNILKARILYNLALSHNKIAEYDTALRIIKEVLILGDADNKLIYNATILMGNIFGRMNDEETSLKTFESLLNNPNKDYLLYHNIANTLFRLGKEKECLEYLEKAIKIQINNESKETTFSLLLSGKVYKKEKRFSEAYIYFNYAIGNATKFNQSNELVKAYELCYEMFNETNNKRYFENMIEGAIETIFKSLKDHEKILKMTHILLDYFTSTEQDKRGEKLISQIKKREE